MNNETTTSLNEQPAPGEAQAEPGPGLSALVQALAAAAAEFDPVLADANNPHFGSRYATLGALISATRPALASHGLVLSQTLEPQPAGTVELVTTLRHADGGSLQSRFPLPPWKGPQDLGSLLTYLRRYLAAGLLNVATEFDDDAEQAQTIPNSAQRAERPRAAAKDWQKRGGQRRPAQTRSGTRQETAVVPGELADAIDRAPDLGALDALVPSLARLPIDERPPLRVRFSDRRKALAELAEDRAELDAVTAADNPEETPAETEEATP